MSDENPTMAAQLDACRRVLAWFVAKLEDDGAWPLVQAFEQGALGQWDDFELDWPETLARLRDPAAAGSPHSESVARHFELAGMYRQARALAAGASPGDLPTRAALDAALHDARDQAAYWERKHDAKRDDLVATEEKFEEARRALDALRGGDDAR